MLRCISSYMVTVLYCSYMVTVFIFKLGQHPFFCRDGCRCTCIVYITQQRKRHWWCTMDRKTIIVRLDGSFIPFQGFRSKLIDGRQPLYLQTMVSKKNRQSFIMNAKRKPENICHRRLVFWG